jgi:hypothetical protein
MNKIIGFALCLGFVIISLSTLQIEGKHKYGYKWEEYKPNLFEQLQTIDDIIEYCDSAVGKQNRKSLEYNEFLGLLLRKRFYHGYSYYSFNQNPFAYLTGKLIWQDLSAIVLPNDIMKYPMAACSQQAIVRRACFKRLGIPFRKVGLKGHFVIEGKIEDNWYLFDSNLEPQFVRGRKSLNTLMASGEIFSAYKQRKTIAEITNMFTSPQYAKVNGYFAFNATTFQYGCKIVFYLLPFAGLFLVISTLKKGKTVSRRISIKRHRRVKIYKNQEEMV